MAPTTHAKLAEAMVESASQSSPCPPLRVVPYSLWIPPHVYTGCMATTKQDRCGDRNAVTHSTERPCVPCDNDGHKSSVSSGCPHSGLDLDRALV